VAPPGQQVTVEGFRNAYANQQFDTVIIAFYTMAMTYMPVCRELFPDAKIIIDTIDLHFVREQRQAELHHDQQMMQGAMQTRRDELDVYAKADALWAITPVEQELLRKEVAVADISIVPNIHEVLPDSTPFEHRNDLLFVGNFWHPPNAEGLAWFCQEVLPLVRQQLPNIATHVVGANPPEFFQQFSRLGVHLAGWVPDLAPLLGACRLSIAPLLHGAGMKGKVGEALAAGLPVVTTAIGSEGMGLVDGENVLVADSAVAFADAVVRAYSNKSLWLMLAANGTAHMKANYTPSVIQSALRAALIPARTEFLAVPDWSDESTVKRVVDCYARRFQGSDTSTLCLGVIGHDIQAAAAALRAWITDLGHDLDAIPDIELRAMNTADLRNVAPSTIWVPMGGHKPVQLSKVETFDNFPASR
jgi:glycosyltransferase involved in cell wall biosynthesis